MKLSKRQAIIVWIIALIIVVSLGMQVTYFSVMRSQPREHEEYYKALDFYGVRLHRAPAERHIWSFSLFEDQKLPLMIATVLIGALCFFTFGKSVPKKGKKD